MWLVFLVGFARLAQILAVTYEKANLQATGFSTPSVAPLFGVEEFYEIECIGANEASTHLSGHSISREAGENK